MAMNFTDTRTEILLKLWKNVKGGLDLVADSLNDGTFHTVGSNGEAPPSQSGQTTLWFVQAIDKELTERGIRH